MVKRKLSETCCICECNVDGKLVIRDKDWCRPFKDESPICKECFMHWKSFDDKWLVKKVREKLLRRGDGN